MLSTFQAKFVFDIFVVFRDVKTPQGSALMLVKMTATFLLIYKKWHLFAVASLHQSMEELYLFKILHLQWQ